MTTEEIIEIILGSSILTSIVTFILHKRTVKITAEVKNEFENLKGRFMTDLQWKQNACKTMGKIYFHMYRSNSAIKRYFKIKDKNKFMEAEVIKDSNRTIRDIILSEGSLIHPDLIDEANKLVEHYDVWLEKYNTMRVENEDEGLHVFVGPDGYKFPPDAEAGFRKYYLKLWKELYSLDIETTGS